MSDKAALQSQVSNTDGWVRVPVEPTEEMLREGKYAFDDSAETSFRDIYQAMLSAAPKAPQQVSNTPQDGKPVAWIRFCSDGCYEGPIMDCDKRMDGRRESGVWTPLYCTPPQQQEQSDYSPAECAAFDKGWEAGLARGRQQEQSGEAHPLEGLHINQGSLDAAADAYEAEYNAAHTGHDSCGWTWVKTDAVNWLKENHPKLCIKAGLAEMVGKRLYTISRLPLTDTNVRMLQKQLNELRAISPTTPTATASQESGPGQEAELLGVLKKLYVATGDMVSSEPDMPSYLDTEKTFESAMSSAYGALLNSGIIVPAPEEL